MRTRRTEEEELGIPVVGCFSPKTLKILNPFFWKSTTLTNGNATQITLEIFNNLEHVKGLGFAWKALSCFNQIWKSVNTNTLFQKARNSFSCQPSRWEDVSNSEDRPGSSRRRHCSCWLCLHQQVFTSNSLEILLEISFVIKVVCQELYWTIVQGERCGRRLSEEFREGSIFFSEKNLLDIKDIVSKEDSKGENGEEVKVNADVRRVPKMWYGWWR